MCKAWCQVQRKQINYLDIKEHRIRKVLGYHVASTRQKKAHGSEVSASAPRSEDGLRNRFWCQLCHQLPVVLAK